MDPNTLRLMQGSAGAGAKLYVEDVFSTWLYTGNGATQTITNGVDLSGKGGLVWIKGRNDGTRNHRLFDTAQGATNFLESNTSNPQGSSGISLTSFNSSGFSIGSSTPVNTNNDTYASWTFRKAAKFFDVVTWVGDGNTSKTISHNLGSVPGCIITKRISSAADWFVYHRSLATPNENFLTLNFGYPANGSSGINVWNVTSASFRASNFTGSNNLNETYVAYLFAHDAGGFGDSGNESVVSCGSYTGNGSISGPTINLGWEPQWLLFKRTDGNTQWFMHDNMREMSLTNTAYLNAADSAAEGLFGSALYRLLPNGFQLNTSNPNYNASGGTYVYIAIRRGPMKTPTDATKVFDTRTLTQAYNTTTPAVASVTTDLFISGVRNFVHNTWVADRMRGAPLLITDTTDAESGTNYFKFDVQTGVGFGTGVMASNSAFQYFFRRAPGFFDVVAYTGTGANQQVTHNLGVVPEMMIIKSRSGAFGWAVYHSGMGTDLIELQSNIYGSSANPNWWDNGAPTPTLIKTPTGSNAAANRSGDNFVAYLFASCPGVSKVGSYTGTGTTLQVNCGFTSGARFVLIRRKDAGGDWYVWDSARGIVAGNDPYLLLNSTAAEVTGTDYVDTYSAGFEISSTAPAAINANGGSFIFLAVA